MKAADYLTDPEYLSWLNCWWTAGRCPLEFVDWLLDRGLESQAEAARWAATEQRRTVYAEAKLAGPTPKADPDEFFFWAEAYTPTTKWADQLPVEVFKRVKDQSDFNRTGFSTLAAFRRYDTAITALLDCWGLQ